METKYVTVCVRIPVEWNELLKLYLKTQMPRMSKEAVLYNAIGALVNKIRKDVK